MNPMIYILNKDQIDPVKVQQDRYLLKSKADCTYQGGTRTL